MLISSPYFKLHWKPALIWLTSIHWTWKKSCGNNWGPCMVMWCESPVWRPQCTERVLPTPCSLTREYQLTSVPTTQYHFLYALPWYPTQSTSQGTTRRWEGTPLHPAASSPFTWCLQKRTDLNFEFHSQKILNLCLLVLAPFIGQPTHQDGFEV